MTGEAQLILLAEIAIALAGFAGIVATNQFRSTGKFSRGDVVGLILIVHCGAVDAFFALLPMAIFAFGYSEQIAFRISSGVHCINFTLYLYWILTNMRTVRVRSPLARSANGVLYSSAVAIIAINAMNAMNWKFHGEFGPYFLACILPLLLAAYMFIRLVSRPILRAVKASESVQIEGAGLT
jgi:hypothetical protein